MIFRILQKKECKTLYYNGKVDVRKLIISSISFLSSMRIIVEQHGQNARSILNIGKFCRYSTATWVVFSIEDVIVKCNYYIAETLFRLINKYIDS